MIKNNYYELKLVKEINPGDIILHPLYRNDGLLLINRYKKITTSILKNIRNNFPLSMPILVTNSDESFQNFLSDQVHQSSMFKLDLNEIIRAHQNIISSPLSVNFYMEESNQDSTNQNSIFFSPFWESLEDLLESSRLKIRAFKIRNQLISTINENKQIVDLINEIKKYHDALYIHTINSLSISLVIGLSLELSDEELINLGLSTLLADVGFLKIEKDRYKAYLDQHNNNKDLINLHTLLSIELIKEIDICRNKSIILGISEHHEFYNGSGLPSGKKDISLFGRILSISKSYDDMVGGYLEENQIDRMGAQTKLWKGAGTLFDPNILKIFFAKINIFKVDQKVLINDNQIGKIIGFTNYLDEPLLPIVQLESGQVIDFYLNKSDYSIKFLNNSLAK